MITVLSPAKTLDYDTPLPPVTPTVPRFADEAASLARSAARLSQKKLSELMHISPALAKLNAGRFRDFADAPERPAIYAFAGDVYTGFDVHSLDEGQVGFAQDHVRMLSGLYGLLRPLDAIRPYRLEMGTRWAPRHAKLTDWWKGRIAAALADDVTAEGSGTIVNLASKEYWAAVDGRLPASVRVIAVDFREGSERRFVSFHAKKARGAVARWIAEHRLDRVDDLRGFDNDGYAYAADASDADRWTFVRGMTSAVVVGASGGIGGALMTALVDEGAFDRVVGLSRSAAGADHLDLTDEASIAAAAARVAADPPTLVVVATGLLHEGGHAPEKAMRDLDPVWLARQYAVNAIGPALVAKHFLPIMPARGARSVFAVLSARVGSIGDNKLGGWYGYRAAKAALHQLVRTLAIEERRRNDRSIVVALHPGTVDTALSRPFQANVRADQLFAPDRAAVQLLDVIDGLKAPDSGKAFDWEGKEIVP